MSEELEYSAEKTIHGNTVLDVEVDAQGQVVAVWYNCLALPFTQHQVSENRALEMRRMYQENKLQSLLKVVVR